MSRSQNALALKRKQPEPSSPASNLTAQERTLYDIIKNSKNMGIWTRDIKRGSNLPDAIVNKSLKALIAKRLIKEVVNVQMKGKKHFMASEFEPSKELTGGDWYVDGNLDMDLINGLREVSLKHIRGAKYSTVEKTVEAVNRSGVLKLDLTTRQVEEIVEALLLDGKIMKVKSTGTGEFTSFPVGGDCYKCTRQQEPRQGAMASIPCGVCPHLSVCTPDGVISPKTCVYYTKWLDF